MSDFGTMVIVRRADGAGMGAEDRGHLDQAIHTIQAVGQHRDAVGSPLVFRVIGVYRAGGGDCGVVLTEYWFEGIDEGEYGRSVEDLLEADQSVVEAVRAELGAALGAGYVLEMNIGTW